MHQVSAREGFENNQIFLGAKEIVQAVRITLDQDTDCELLAPIDKLLKARRTPAHRLKEVFNDEWSIEKTLQKTYTEFTGYLASVRKLLVRNELTERTFSKTLGIRSSYLV